MAERTVFGQVLFGTTRGLTASGNGVFSTASSSPQIFEFRSPNIHPNEGQELGFRKVIEDPSGNLWDAIGVVIGAKDYAGRPGFFGAAVAVSHKDLSAYYEGFKAASEMCFRIVAGGWESAVSDLVHDKPGQPLLEQRNMKLREADERGGVIALKISESWNEAVPKLYAFAASQVGALMDHNSKFIVIHRNPGIDADEVNIEFLEFLRQKKERERDLAEERILSEHKADSNRRESELLQRIQALELENQEMKESRPLRRPMDGPRTGADREPFARPMGSPRHQSVDESRSVSAYRTKRTSRSHDYSRRSSGHGARKDGWLRKVIGRLNGQWVDVLVWSLSAVLILSLVVIVIVFVAKNAGDFGSLLSVG